MTLAPQSTEQVEAPAAERRTLAYQPALDGLRADLARAPSGGLRMIRLAHADDRDRAAHIGDLSGAAPVCGGAAAHRARASRRAVAIHDA